MSYKNKCIEIELIKDRIHIEIQDFSIGNMDFVQSPIQEFSTILECSCLPLRQINYSPQAQLKGH